jgi:hypothetical protein
MGIQYVTVKVDTSGLFQPLASAAGVIGIIGASPSAGPGFPNPMLFTRPLTGASGEPYARVVPVLKVAPIASDVQTLTVTGSPTGGNFTLSFGGQTTGTIAFNAASADVQTALSALATIGAGNVACTGGPLPANPVTITFTGTMAFKAQQGIALGANNLSGGTTPTPRIDHTTSGAAQVNDVQSLTLVGNPTAGTFTLSFGGQTTGNIPYNGQASDVQNALGALSSVGANSVSCTGGPLPSAAVTITFQKALGASPLPVITAGASTLAGPAPTVKHTTTGVTGANEVQTLSVSGSPTGGGFTLSFGGQTTASIAFNGTAAQVQTALAALSSIQAGNVACAGGSLPASSVSITFQGTLGFAPQNLITIGANTLSGGTTPAPAVARTTPGIHSVNDVQSLSISGTATGGTFALSFQGASTGALPYNATAAQVQAALQALQNIGAGNAVCAGGPLPGSAVTITFQNALSAAPQPAISIADNSLTTSTTPAAVVTHVTTGVGTTSLATPVDPDDGIIPGLVWDPTRFVLLDSATNAPLTVDVANQKLRYASGAAFQNGGEDAVVAFDGFSIVSGMSSPAPYWGILLDVDGQPVPNLLMRPDAPPAGAFVDFARNTLSIDGVLGNTDKGTGKPKSAGGNIYYKVSFDICALAKSVNVALVNGALSVWGYRLDPVTSPAAFDASAAYADFANRDINIVCLSYDSDPDHITELKNRVEASSPNDAGGGGIRPRIGVAMLPNGGIVDAQGNLTNKFSDWKTLEQQTNNLPSPMNWSSSRMVFVAANSADDTACAAAGVIAGLDPWVSLILKPVNSIGINGPLSDQAIQVYIAPDQSGLVQPHVIPIVHPDFLAGSGPVMGEGFSADGTGQRLYVDIVRTIDDIAFRLKATLTSPQVIGTLRINRLGLRVLSASIRAMLRTRVDAGEIDDFAIDIPIQALTEKDPSQLTPAEQQQLQQVQNSRQLGLNVSVTYAGWIHQLLVFLKFI